MVSHKDTNVNKTLAYVMTIVFLIQIAGLI